MSRDTKEQLHHLYGEIAISATKLQESLASFEGNADVHDNPSEVACVTTLRESLDRLNAQATIAFERGLASVGM